MPYRNTKGKLMLRHTFLVNWYWRVISCGSVSSNIRKNTWKGINWSHKGILIEEPRYLPVCYQTTESSKDRIIYSGQHQFLIDVFFSAYPVLPSFQPGSLITCPINKYLCLHYVSWAKPTIGNYTLLQATEYLHMCIVNLFYWLFLVRHYPRPSLQDFPHF